jgi:AcrR family transcriptional regulator
MTTDTADHSRERYEMLDHAARIVAERGLETLGIRSLAAATGRTTGVILKKFGNKERLVSSLINHAIGLSRRFHDALAQTLSGTAITGRSLYDVLTFYIVNGGAHPCEHVLGEVLTKKHLFVPDAAQLTDWRATRYAFWRSVLPPEVPGTLADFLAIYTTAEQLFAAGLRSDPRYHVLLGETLDGLLGLNPNITEPPMMSQLSALFLARDHSARKEAEKVARLLAKAVAAIRHSGLASLNLRGFAKQAGVAPSLINYHFGSFAAFLDRAVWRAMAQDLPGWLDSGSKPHQDANWLDLLEHSYRAGPDGGAGGFYIDYMRNLGQLSLLSIQQPDYRPLLLELRAIEGLGNYNASRTQWPARFSLSRGQAAAFAIWLKGRALTDAALGIEPGSEQTRILAALGCLKHTSQS